MSQMVSHNFVILSLCVAPGQDLCKNRKGTFKFSNPVWIIYQHTGFYAWGYGPVLVCQLFGQNIHISITTGIWVNQEIYLLLCADAKGNCFDESVYQHVDIEHEKPPVGFTDVWHTSFKLLSNYLKTTALKLPCKLECEQNDNIDFSMAIWT